MKKILPILTITTAVLMLSGCNLSMNTSNNTIKENVDTFMSTTNEYFKLRDDNTTKTTLTKYTMNIDIPEDSLAIDQQPDQPIIETAQLDDYSSEESNSDDLPQDNEDILNNPLEDTQISDSNDNFELDENENTSKYTLYSLSRDIEDSCDEFCELKQDISNAIVETQNLLNKIQNNELDLNAEQKIFLIEQSSQLKTLSKQLSQATNNLSFQLSSLDLLTKTNGSIDDINLKYLLILNSLMNDNEMLTNSLLSLNMMNQMLNMTGSYNQMNNNGRILYGYQKNDEPPIIKDYIIEENGNIVENLPNDTNINDTDNIEEISEEKNGNIDSYTNTNLVSNIDTYGNPNQNIDTFFNTALLDNEFMYGNNYGGYNMGMYGINPNLNQYSMYENQNKNIANNDHANNENLLKNTENNENNATNDAKKHKKFKISKNIDTYRDEKTPDLKSKFQKIKSTFTDIFMNINKADDNIKNPIYHSFDNE